MSMNLTKLTNAEYPLSDAREAIDGDNALNPSDPSAYYTAAGNPPGYWIGKGAELVGGKVGTTASSKTVRESSTNGATHPTANTSETSN